ncbi:hypothetical protein Pfo_006744 [Paulownia fortunei]|nr:hypothetical protein Pfo_006744 [Paulownia fortunei]
MGIHTMNSHVSGGRRQYHVHYPMPRQNSWFSLTLAEVKNQLGDLGKPLGSMNFDKLLKSRQASLLLAKDFSGKIVNEVLRDIQQGHKMRNVKEMHSQERKPMLGEKTLEDFLVKEGMHVANASLEPIMSLDSALNSQNFSTEIGSPLSIDVLSDTPMPCWKRCPGDLEKTLERRQRQKIKNRESIAHSRARKQIGLEFVYHNELVSKVSLLEEENVKLKKEKNIRNDSVCCNNHVKTGKEIRKILERKSYIS